MSDTTAGYRPDDGHSLDTELESLLGELIQDWKSGTPQPLRAYLERRPELIGRPVVVVELINQEVILRQMLGERPQPADYLAEFPELTESLERLFEVHALTFDTVQLPQGTMAGSAFVRPHTTRPAAGRLPEIPGYEIERFLGRGGMGIVYLARHQGLNRRVALKLLQESSQDDPGLVARFRREAEAAARCQHPNLVQIHDVGEHAGEHYLALEYVSGGHLGRALAGAPQPPRKAAELVETLARAIDHAHAQGVIHRDLKPANVLLTADGQPKITDFGLAKLRDGSTNTEVGTVLGTLAYMAPEQVQARSGEIGPRTDIHALGAILYEALTGRPPYRAETPERILHAILAEEVVPPSVRQPGVPRDLEAICLKCLEREPSRRYATAADLAEDLRRFLDGRPTAARPASTVQRAFRWCQRNRGAVAAIAALLLLSIVSAWQAVRATMAERTAQTEAEISQAVNAFLTEDILGRAWVGSESQFDPSLVSDLKVRTALDIATEKIGERFKGRPLIEAAIRYAIGNAYLELRLDAQAAPQFERAVALRSQVLGVGDPQTLIARCRLGLALMKVRPAEAERDLVSAMSGLLAARGEGDAEVFIAMQGVGDVSIDRDKLAEGRELLWRAVRGLRMSRGPAHLDTLAATQDLATALHAQGQREEARHLVKESIRMAEEPAGNESLTAIEAKVRLEPVLVAIGEEAEAVRLLEEILAVQQRILGDGHHGTLLSMAMLAQYYQFAGRYGEAESLLFKALPECRKVFDRNHAITSLVLGGLAVQYTRNHDFEKLRECMCEAVDITRALRGADDQYTDHGTATLSILYLKTGELAAERYLRDHLTYLLRHKPEDDDRYVSEGRIGFCLLRRNAVAQAEPPLRLAYEWIAPRVHDVSPNVLNGFKDFESGVIQSYEEAGNKDQAAIWKARRMDLDFPADLFAPK
jgi:eukaryotic-like serine/threonine-protein kinase